MKNGPGPFQITINGAVVQVTPSTAAIRYIGVWVCMVLSWTEQVRQLSWRISLYCRLALRHHLPITTAVYFFNTFLMSKIEHILRHCFIPAPSLKRWDRIIAHTVSQLAGSPHFRFHAHAVAYLCGVALPSSRYSVIRSSELFFRLSSRSHCASLSLERARDVHCPLKYNRALRIQKQTVKRYKLSLVLSSSRDSWMSCPAFPPGLARTRIATMHGIPSLVVFGFLGHWGASLVPRSIKILVTASTKGGAAWSIGFDPSIPSFSHFSSSSPVRDRHCLTIQAVAIALFACPVSWSIEILLLDDSVLRSILTFLSTPSTRVKLRTPGRPALHLIHRLAEQHTAYGSRISFFAANISIPSIASAVAILDAEVATAATVPALPSFALELVHGEQGCLLHSGSTISNSSLVLADPRQHLNRMEVKSSLAKWSISKSQSVFAGDYARDLYRVVAKEGSPLEIALCLRICTNTVHHVRLDDNEGSPTLLCKLPGCVAPSSASPASASSVVCSVTHMLRCQAPLAVIRRYRIKRDLLHLIAVSSDEGKDWHAGLPYSKILPDLPLSAILQRLLNPRLASPGLVEYRFCFGAWSNTEQATAAAISSCSVEAWTQVRMLLFRSMVSFCLDQFKRANLKPFPRC